MDVEPQDQEVLTRKEPMALKERKDTRFYFPNAAHLVDIPLPLLTEYDEQLTQLGEFLDDRINFLTLNAARKRFSDFFRSYVRLSQQAERVSFSCWAETNDILVVFGKQKKVLSLKDLLGGNFNFFPHETNEAHYEEGWVGISRLELNSATDLFSALHEASHIILENFTHLEQRRAQLEKEIQELSAKRIRAQRPGEGNIDLIREIEGKEEEKKRLTVVLESLVWNLAWEIGGRCAQKNTPIFSPEEKNKLVDYQKKKLAKWQHPHSY